MEDLLKRGRLPTILLCVVLLIALGALKTVLGWLPMAGDLFNLLSIAVVLLMIYLAGVELFMWWRNQRAND